MSRCLMLLVAVSLMSAMVSPLWAADYSRVGVRPGDTANYVVSVSRMAVEGETVDSHNMSLAILDVNGTTIVFSETDLAPNGAVSNTQLLTLNVSSGGLPNSPFVLGNFTPLIVATGLAVGDPFYLGSTAKINETFTRKFAGANRVCNFFTIHPPDISVMEWGYYWDQATGLMVREFKTIFTLPGILRYETELVATSLWSPDDPFSGLGLIIPPIAFLIGGSFALVLVGKAVVVIRRWRSRPSPVRPAREETRMTIAGHVKHCAECGAILAEKASYCLNCGEPIQDAQFSKRGEIPSKLAAQSRSNAALVGQNCMVCHLPVRRGEELVRCPHCNNIAHKTHMLEWLHVKGTCPVCGEHIEHSSLRT